MARRVKCRICKAQGCTDTFYKVTNEKGTNAYYCSKEEYDAREKEKSDRYELLKYIAEEVLEYEDGQIVPPSMVKRIEKLRDFYPFEVIHEVFRLNKETIQYWIRVKDFSNEFGMVSYIIKIVEGNINDIYKQWKHRQQQKVKEESQIIDIEIINDVSLHKETITNENDGITQFLDEEDI